MRRRRTDPGWKASRVQSHFWHWPGRNASQANTILHRGTLHHTDGREEVSGGCVDRLISVFSLGWFTVTMSTLSIKSLPSALIPCHFFSPPLATKLFPCLSRVTFTLRRPIHKHAQACVRSQLLIANTAKHHRNASRLLSKTCVPPWLLFHPRANIKKKKWECYVPNYDKKNKYNKWRHGRGALKKRCVVFLRQKGFFFFFLLLITGQRAVEIIS